MKLSFRFILFLAALFIFNAVHTVRAGKIVYPWRATTAIVKSGETFEVWFDADSGQTVSSVGLEGPYKDVAATMSVQTGSWEYDFASGNTYNTKITVTVPADTPEDRYELVVSTSAGQERSRGAVKVLKQYRSEYYVAHFSDSHRYQNGYDTVNTMRKISTILDIADIMDVQMVFETGDNLYSPNETRLSEMFDGIPPEGTRGLLKAHGATFVVAGNHDAVGNVHTPGEAEADARLWNQNYGLQMYNVAYGNGRYLFVNDAWGGGDMNYTLQANNGNAWLNNVAGRGNLIVAVAHCRQTSIIKWHEIIGLNAALAGHQHGVAGQNPDRISTDPASPYYNDRIQWVADTNREDTKFQFLLYKVSDANGTWSPVGNSTAQVLPIQSEAAAVVTNPDSWIPNLELSYSSLNNGTVPENTATIVNRFDFAINGARVRFVMPLGSSYAVPGATILQAFDGDSVHIVDVKVNLSANSTTEVEIVGAGGVTNNAQFISMSVPEVMTQGESYPVTVEIENIGLESWTPAAGHRLVSQNPPSNSTWGVSEVLLTESVAVDQTVTFSFTVTAPAERGAYDFQWRMLDATAPNQGWFGPTTPNVEIQVGPEDIHMEAEDFTMTDGDDGVGFQTQATSDVGGGENIGFTAVNDYATYDLNITHAGVYKVYFRYSSATAGAQLDLKNGSTVLCSVDEPATGDFQVWQTSPAYLVTLPEGALTLTVFATGPSWNMNWFELIPLDDPPGNVPPVIHSSPDTTALENEAYRYIVSATDADPDTLTYAAPVKPDWLSFNTGTRVLSGKPVAEDVGTDAVELTVFDGTVTVTQRFDIVVSAEPVLPAGQVILAVDLHQNATDPVPDTPDSFSGWFVGNVSAGVAAPTTTINDYGITLGSGTSINCLVNPALQTGINARNRSSGYITNQIGFTQADMMRERVGSLGNPTDPATGQGTGNGLYLKVEGLDADTDYMIRAWSIDTTGTFADSNVRLKNGYNYGFDATDETAGYTHLPQVGTYTVSGNPTTISDNEQFSVSGIITTDSNGTLIYKQISSIDRSVMNGFVLYTVDVASLEGYELWADKNSITGGPLDDDNVDGLNNFLTYAVGEKPEMLLDASSMLFIHQLRNDDPALTYTLETRTNLVAGSWALSGFTILGTNKTGGVYDEVTNNVPVSDPQAFIRLKVDQQN